MPELAPDLGPQPGTVGQEPEVDEADLDEEAAGRPAPYRFDGPTWDVWRNVVVVGLALVVSLARRVSLLVNPALVVEDGTVFFADQLNHGFRPFDAYNGAIYLVPRVAAAAIDLILPVEAAPRAYYVGACALAVLPFALVLRRGAEPVFGRWPWRAGLLMFLAALPGSSTTQGTLANLQWWYLPALAVILVLPAPAARAGRYAELALVAALGLTGPVCLFVTPLALWSALRIRAAHEWARAATVGGAAVVQAALFLGSPRLDVDRSLAKLADVGPYLVNRWVSGTFVLGEFNNAIYWATRHHTWLLLAALLVSLGAVATAVSAWRRPAPWWLIAAVGVAGAGFLTVPTAQVAAMTMGEPTQSRYFAGAVGVLVLLVFHGAAASPLKWVRVGSAALIGASLVGVVGDLRVVQWERAPGSIGMDEFARCLEEATTEWCEMTGFPPDWRIRVRP